MKSLLSAIGLIKHNKCRDLERKFSALEAAQSVVEFDAEANLVSANKIFCDLIGMTIDRLENSTLESILYDPVEHKNYWSELSQGRSHAGVFAFRSNNGEIVYLQGTYLPVFDPDNTLESVTFLGVDITQGYTTACHQKIFSEMAAPALLIDMADDAVVISDAFSRWVENAPLSLKSAFVKNQTISLDKIKVRELINAFFTEENIDWEEKNKKTFTTEIDGRIIELDICLIENATNQYQVLRFKDVTQSSWDKKALLQAKRRVEIFRSQVAGSLMPTCITDSEFNVQLSSEAYRDCTRNENETNNKENFFACVDKKFGNAVRNALKNSDRESGFTGEVHELHIDFRIVCLSDDPNDADYYLIEWRDSSTLYQEKNQNVVLRKENRSYEDMLDALDIGALSVDPNGLITRINRRMLSMLSRVLSGSKSYTKNSIEGVNVCELFSHQLKGAVPKDLRNAFTRDFSCGDFFGQVVSTPVGHKDEFQGAVMKWSDRSQEASAEKDIRCMLDAACRGDFSKHVTTEGKDGFLLGLCEGLNELVSTMEVTLNDVVRMLGAMAKGDLSERITRNYEGAFGQLKIDANSTADALSEVIQQIRQSSSAIVSTASEIAQGNVDLSARTEQQAASLEQTAASMEEMTSTVRQSAENADKAENMIINTQSLAREGGTVVEKAVKAMSEINNSSKQISDIISVIDEIAFQTNLLALNAAVEAARAGEQGRGFAVVAGEVRNLAQRSAGAAKEIKGLIQDSVSKVEDGTNLVNRSGRVLHEIVESVDTVTNMMQEIAAASKEQSTGIEQVNMAVTNMDEMTQQNAALVEQATAASETMSNQAKAMHSGVAFFSNVSGNNSAQNFTGHALTLEHSNLRAANLPPSWQPEKQAPTFSAAKDKRSKSKLLPEDVKESRLSTLTNSSAAPAGTGQGSQFVAVDAQDTSDFDDDDEWEEF